MPSKKATLLAVLSATVAAATAPAALAMPIGAGLGTPTPLLQRTAAEQHRVYPGSESAAAEKARADRNAPNMFCEKQENKCE